MRVIISSIPRSTREIGQHAAARRGHLRGELSHGERGHADHSKDKIDDDALRQNRTVAVARCRRHVFGARLTLDGILQDLQFRPEEGIQGTRREAQRRQSVAELGHRDDVALDERQYRVGEMNDTSKAGRGPVDRVRVRRRKERSRPWNDTVRRQERELTGKRLRRLAHVPLPDAAAPRS